MLSRWLPIAALSFIFFCLSFSPAWAQIDRHAVVSRNNPHVVALDSLSSLTVGNGGFAFTVDATGLQTFPYIYRNGVPLGTMSDWGWHSFPNTEGYDAAEALKDFDFGHTNKLPDWDGGEPYSVENKDDARSKAAASYLRANPHRLHLGCVGLGIHEPEQVKDINQTLDLWTGIITSRFSYKGKRYTVETACHPDRDLIAVRVRVKLPDDSDSPKSSDRFESQEKQESPASLEASGYQQAADNTESIILQFPYPSGQHSDDACVWDDRDNQNWERHWTRTVHADDHGVLLRRDIDSTSYFVALNWQGEPVEIFNDGAFPLDNLMQEFGFAGTEFSFTCEFLPSLSSPLASHSFADVAAASAAHWQQYWQQGGIIDFSHCRDPRARELERRAVLSQYLLAVNCAGDTPPQETGLTYNSWFGKFHLEMIWWHQAQFALWGHPELLEHTLDWYFDALPKARAIAHRQGFPGVRWMKMTDPSAEEAPSKVGSFLIWQQPHIIYLAELLRRASSSSERIMQKYWPLVESTAEFMYAFADKDKTANRYVLRGIIPAQETLSAAETMNPPFELAYWQWGLNTAALWSLRLNQDSKADWRMVAGRLASLAFNSDSLYLAAETATDTYRDIRFTSDHPAVLGAYGILPWSTQLDYRVMKKTLNWIWDNWNWDKTWGWDYPMVAMNAARMGDPEKAVGALLMPKRTNTYLVNGHNYQDQRLRLYLPGNGGLLTALALMCAGWDGCNKKNPGFPKDGNWDVRWEGLLPLP